MPATKDAPEKPKPAKRRWPHAPVTAAPETGFDAPGSPLINAAGTYFSPGALDRHARLLGDVRLSHTANAGQRARPVRQLHRNYGNQHVQRLVERARKARVAEVAIPRDSGGELARQPEEEELQMARRLLHRQTEGAAATTPQGTPSATPATAPAAGATEAAAKTTPDPAKLSGKKWWDANEANAPYTKSDQISDLEADFQAKITEFKAALEAAGADIRIDTTKRPKERAHILHYAWNVANDKIKASAVPSMDGVNIMWDHGDDEKSKVGAQEILTAASVAATEPSLTSRHIEGKAIDWTIRWTKDLTIKQKDGTEKVIKGPGNGGDPPGGSAELHAVGKGYGVIKGIFKKADNPHWSSDGS